MKSLEELTLEEIELLDNQQLLYEYNQMINSLKTNRIAKEVVEDLNGESIVTILTKVKQEEESYRSYEFFPGDLVILYPKISEMRSRDYKTCDFSGAVIHPHSLYVSYRPLIENITKKEVYVLKKTLHVEVGYAYNLPENIMQLESLNFNIEHENDDDEINFSHLHQVTGGGITLQKLNYKPSYKRLEKRIKWK